ncbi:hypothetical protein BHM03_00036585, partial [Ensete ventricosum]
FWRKVNSSTIPRDQFNAYEEEDKEEVGSKGARPGASEGDEVGEETGGLEVGGGDGGRDEEKRWASYASHHDDQLLPCW